MAPLLYAFGQVDRVGHYSVRLVEGQLVPPQLLDVEVGVRLDEAVGELAERVESGRDCRHPEKVLVRRN